MKLIKRIVIGAVVVIVIGGLILRSNLDSIIRGVIERQASASMGVPTTLGSASLSILGGQVKLANFQVASPPKFPSPNIFTLDAIGVSVNYGQLTGSPIHIKAIEIDHPVLVVEQSDMQLNLKALMDQMPQTPQTSGGQPTKPIMLIIDELDLNNALVTFLPGIPGMTKPIQITVPSLTLKNIGNADGNQNGAAIKDVVMQTATALAAKGADTANLPPEAKALLAGDFSGLSQQLGAEFNKQFQGAAGGLMKNLPADVGNVLNNKSGGGTNPLQQLLNGNKKSGS